LALIAEPQVFAPTGIDFGPKQALADDDDDGGGGGRRGNGGRSSDDDDDDYRSTGPNLFRALSDRFLPRQRRETRRQRPAPRPVRAPDEIVATGVTAPQLAALEADGFTVLDRTVVAALGGEVLRLRIPTRTGLEAARDLVISASPQSLADFSHYYRPEEAEQECSGLHCAAAELIGWPGPLTSLPGCGAPGTIGLVDTAINPRHASFEGGQIEVIRLSDATLPESGRQHGTAVAALLGGSAGSRTPGLVPGARILAVDAFHRGGRSDDRAGVYDLIRALDLLDKRRVKVTNMSLSGPANTLLEKLVSALADNGMVIVAAAGNDGPRAAPAYPAAYGPVIAVTAVDRAKRPYRRAGRGAHIDLAAPGIDIWTAASVSGGRTKTGTSFAAPFVTAAVSLLKSGRPQATPEEILAALASSAEDLGDVGRDPIFGFGLVNVGAA